MSDVFQTSEQDSSKGKGANHTAFEFKSDVAIGWCRNQTFGEIKKIWASGELIFIGGDQLITGTGECNVEPITEWGIFDVEGESPPLCNTPDGLASERIVAERIIYRFFSSEVGATFVEQFSFLQSNQPVTISGPGLFANNAGTFELQGAGSHESGGLTVYELIVIKCTPQYDDIVGIDSSFCDPIAGTGCDPGTPQNNIVVTFEQIIVDPFSPYFDEITCYDGNDLQQPDPLLESHVGSGQVPAFRGTTYCVLTQFNMTKWAGTLPAFEAWVEEVEGPKPIEDVMIALVARTEGFDLSWLDVSRLVSANIKTRGLFLIGPSAPSEMMDQLLLLYDLEMQEVSVIAPGGVTPQPSLQILPRVDTQTVTIPAKDLGASDFGQQGPLGAQITRATKEDLPQEIILDYIVGHGNDNLDVFLPGTVSYSVVQSAVRNQQKLTVSVTMLQTEADARIRVILWALILRHDRIAFSLPPSYSNLIPGDRALVTLPNGSLVQCRLVKVDRGSQGLMKVEAQLDDSSIYVQTGGSYTLPEAPLGLPFPPFMSPIVLDIPPLTSVEAQTFGITVAVRTSQGAFGFPGGTLFSSNDQILWDLESSFSIPGVTGRVTTRLPPASPYFWDYTGTVDVVMDGFGMLDNSNEEQVAGGTNWCLIGGEILGFQTATLIDSNSYTLSGLIRGRRNTEVFSERQSPIGASFVMLFIAKGATFFDLEPSAFNNQRTVRAVPSGRSVEDQGIGSDAQLKPIAQSLKPFSVHGVWAIRKNSSDVCLWCTSRTRVPFRIFSGVFPVPTVEPPIETDALSFKCIIFRPNIAQDEWVEVRTVAGCFAANSQIVFSYTRAEQITDAEQNGFDPNVPSEWLKFDIRRDSTSIGTGRLRTFCIQGNGVRFASADCSVIA